MDGYKKGYLGHQSTTSAASYQLSAADHYSDTMICLWGFLLLVVATSSVDSQCVGTMESQNTALQNALQNQCNKKSNWPNIFDLDLKNNLQSLFSGLNGIISALTGVVFGPAQVMYAEIHNKTNGLELRAGIIIDVSCLQINRFQITLGLSIPVDLKAMDGCLRLDVSGEMKMNASINNSMLNLNLGTVTAIVTALQNTLTGPVKSILTQALANLNLKYGDVTNPFFISGNACRHNVTGLTLQGAFIIVQMATSIGKILLPWGSVGKMSLARNETIGWNLPSYIIGALIGEALSVFQTKIYLTQAQMGNQSWAAQFTNGSLQLSNANVTKTNVSGSGISLNVAISYSLSNGLTNVSSGTVDVILTGQPKYDNGFLGLYISAFSINAVFIDVLLVNAMGDDCTCGGGDKMKAWFIDHLKYQTTFLISQFNSLFAFIFKLPYVFGQPRLNGECKPKTDYFQCYC